MGEGDLAQLHRWLLACADQPPDQALCVAWQALGQRGKFALLDLSQTLREDPDHRGAAQAVKLLGEIADGEVVSRLIALWDRVPPDSVAAGALLDALAAAGPVAVPALQAQLEHAPSLWREEEDAVHPLVQVLSAIGADHPEAEHTAVAFLERELRRDRPPGRRTQRLNAALVRNLALMRATQAAPAVEEAIAGGRVALDDIAPSDLEALGVTAGRAYRACGRTPDGCPRRNL
ncbi:MAG: hypothetical protein M0031_00450 [Thermaerobacter sp.]|nr:hypothetical protein [Thermaerobacter sp.]